MNSSIRKTKITYSFPVDSEITALTISPESLPLIPPISFFNVTCDLTLNKSLHLPNQKTRKVLELSIEQQKRFLEDSYRTVLERYNSFGEDNIKCMFIIYEVQPGTLALHAHANFHIDVKTNEEYPLAKLLDITSALGFKRVGSYVSYIKFPESRWEYLLKRNTKYPVPFIILEPGHDAKHL